MGQNSLRNSLRSPCFANAIGDIRHRLYINHVLPPLAICAYFIILLVQPSIRNYPVRDKNVPDSSTAPDIIPNGINYSAALCASGEEGIDFGARRGGRRASGKAAALDGRNCRAEAGSCSALERSIVTHARKTVLLLLFTYQSYIAGRRPTAMVRAGRRMIAPIYRANGQ